MKLLVLDGNSIVNRAFYGIKLLTTKTGQYTNAIYGFLNILQRLVADEKPDEVAVAFDLKAPTFRHKMYDGYKAQRKGMPEELAQQMPVLKQLLEDLGYVTVSAEGWEADDILGTLAKACKSRGDACVIATGDRDSLQLIDENVKVLLASTSMGKSLTIPMGLEQVQEKYGVTPHQLIEVKALMGDSSDNIPGVAGVGEKTALTLIQNFGTLDGVYENLDNTIIKPGVRAKLEKDKQMAYLSRKLAEISTQAPVPLEAGSYVRQAGEAEKATATLQGLEMYTMIDKLALKNAPAQQLSFELAADDLHRVAVKPLPRVRGCVYMAKSESGMWVVVQDSNVYVAVATEGSLLALLADEKTEKRVFDAKALYHLCLDMGIEAKNITFDAKLAAYLLNPAASSYTVEHLAGEYQIGRAWQCEEADAPYLESLFTKLQQACEKQGMAELLNEIELPLCAVLAQMEHTGIQVDKAGIEAFGLTLQETIKSELAIIYEAVGYEFNVNSPKQLAKALYEELRLPTGKKTKSGFSTDAETLEGLRHYDPIIEHILQYRIYQKLNSTYVEGLLKVIGEDGRVHSTFNQTETRTGRISSGEPNLQNIPVRTPLGSQLRRYFIAPKGYVLLDADYSQIELRILAHISGDEAMIEAFNSGADIHRSTAAKIYGLPDEMVTSQLRSSAKAVNFGIVYGIGAFSLSKDINVSVKEADAFIKNYLDNFKGVKQYMDTTIAEGTKNGYVATMYGRRRPLPELSSSNRNIKMLGERMAMNTPIQGTAADIIKLAMVRVAQRLAQEGLEAKLILQVHDELIVECPLAEQEKAAAILGEEMQNAAKLKVCLKADVNSGENWYDAKG
ncbi:MAG: DNA polymerase I [Oscillospiraceae bacterium]|nr:DNA polymerase I [Oscillospiraceae bacterium]